MKTRLGFVTNSSSSNFLIALKDTKKPLLATYVFEVFETKMTSPLAEQLGKESFAFVEKAENVTVRYLDKLEDWGDHDIAVKALEFIKKGWKVFHVYIDVGEVPVFRCLPELTETEMVAIWSLDGRRQAAFEN